MEPKELARLNSQAIDKSIQAVRDIVNNEKLSVQEKLTQLTSRMELDSKGIVVSSKHNHGILGECVGICRVSALRAARLIGEEYKNSSKSININIDGYATWLNG